MDVKKDELPADVHDTLSTDKKYKQYFDKSPVGFFIIDRNGHYIEVNRSGAELLGYSEEEILSKSVSDLSFPEDKQETRALFQKLTETGKLRLERRLKHRNGSPVYVVLDAAPLPGDRFLFTFSDISDKKTVEASLLESEERFHQLFDNINTGVAIYRALDGGSDFEFVDLNKAGEKHSNARRNEIIGRKVTEVFPGIREMGLLEVFRRVWQTGVPEYLPLTMYKDANLEEWVENYVYKLPSGLIVALYDDTSEKHKAEEALKQSEAELSAIFNMSLDLICIADIKTATFLRVNPSFTKVLGFSEEELLGRPFLEFIHPDDVEPTKAVIAEKLRKGESVIAFENRYCAKDGSYVWLDWNSHPQVDRGITFAVAHDVTDRKRAEEAMKSSLREKETLLRELYHRTKNNMQVISSLLSLQTLQTDNPKVREVVKDTKNRIQSISLVHQMLYKTQNLSRIDLGEYVSELVSLLIGGFAVPENKIAVDIDIDSIQVVIDVAIPGGLILNELITNSFKYAFPEGKSGRIRIGVSRRQGVMLLTYSDTGVGFPPGLDPRKSNSLGLQIVFNIAEHQLGGNVEIESGEGVSFTISFPDSVYEERIEAGNV